jgi:hypothetical protein
MFNFTYYFLKKYDSFIQLPDPKTGISVTFLQSGKKLLELQSSELRRHNSFFVNQRVSSDGRFYFGVNYDPRFLILPFLEKNALKFSPLDQIVTVSPNCSRIPLEDCKNWKIDEVADVNDKLGDDMILYRYNLQKVIQWLRKKVENTAKVIMKQRLEEKTSSNIVNSVDFSFQSSKPVNLKEESGNVAEVEPSREDLIKAVLIVSDYVTDSASKLLCESFGFSQSDLSDTNTRKSETKRKSDWEEELEVITTFIFSYKAFKNK